MVVDGQRLFRDAVEIALELRPLVQLVASVSDVSQAVDQARRSKADVVLMTSDAGDDSQLDVVAALRKARPDCRIVALLDDEDDLSNVALLIRQGAVGFVSRRCSSKELVSAIEMAHSGGAVLPAPVLRKLLMRTLPSRDDPAKAPVDLTEAPTKRVKLP
ncbi:MAG: response regulator [Actinomycetota bacterium]